MAKIGAEAGNKLEEIEEEKEDLPSDSDDESEQGMDDKYDPLAK